MNNTTPTISGLTDLDTVAKGWMKYSRRKLEKDIASGLFGPDVIKLGRTCRVRAAELDEWIRAGCPCREAWLRMRSEGGAA